MTSSFRAERGAQRVFVPDPWSGGSRSFRGDGEALAADAADGPGTPPEAAPATADADPEAPLREAYERGLTEGRAALPWTEAQRLTTACRALEEAARQLGVRADATERIDRGLAVELGLAVARRVLAREIRADLDVLAPLVEHAFAVLPTREGLTLQLSPADLETLDAGRAPEIERIRRHAGAELAADARLAPGDVRLQAGGSAVDLRLDAVLDRFRRELLTLAGREEERS